MKLIDQIWDKLFEYWKQHEPDFTGCKEAGEKEIISLEDSLGIKLPESLKTSLTRCNSYPNENQKTQNSSCLLTGGSGRLFDTNEIKETYHNLNSHRFFDGEALDYMYVDKNLDSNTRWSKYFIPIYSWNCDVYALLDLRPNSSNFGQVLYEYPESDTLGVWAKSYERFLQLIADSILDHGAFNNKDMDNIWQKIYDETRKTCT